MFDHIMHLRNINTVKSVIRLATKNKHPKNIEIICSCVNVFIF